MLGADPGRADRAWRNRIGIVQTTGGLDLLTVGEVLRSTARAYSEPRRVDEVLESVGMADKAHERVSSLSGGQRRRLDVALGIVARPELLFLAAVQSCAALAYATTGRHSCFVGTAIEALFGQGRWGRAGSGRKPLTSQPVSPSSMPVHPGAFRNFRCGKVTIHVLPVVLVRLVSGLGGVVS